MTRRRTGGIVENESGHGEPGAELAELGDEELAPPGGEEEAPGPTTQPQALESLHSRLEA